MSNRRMIRHALAVLPATLLSFSLAQSAQEPDRSDLPPINLTSAIESAVKSTPQSQIAKESLELARWDVKTARAPLLPNANVAYNFSHSKNPITLGIGNTVAGYASGAANQTLFNLPAFFSYQSAKERLKAASSALDATELRIAGQAAATFLDVLSVRITLDLAKENHDFMQSLIQSMKSGDLKSLAKAQDVELAEAALSAALSNKHVWLKDATVAENNFTKDVRLLAKEYYLVEPTALAIPADDSQALAVAYHRNPLLAAARARVQAAQKDVRAAKSTYLPRVDAQFSAYHNNRGPGVFPEFRQGGTVAGLNVGFNVYDAARGPMLEAQKTKQKISELQLEDQALALETNLKNIYVGVRERRNNLKGLCDGLRTRLSTVESMHTQLIKGVSTQDFLYQRSELLKIAISLNSEFLAETLDSYNILIQVGTLFENLPPASNPNQSQGPNPYFKGLQVYKRLLNRCESQGLL